MLQPPPGASLRHGATDRRVTGLRDRLLRAGAPDTGIAPDAVADPTVFDRSVDRAVRAFQQHRGLIVDGVVGPETESALNDAQYSLGDRPLALDPDQPLHGDDVEDLQNNLSLLGFYYGHLDGRFNRQTDLAVRELQNSLGLPEDGVVALETLTGLARVSKKITSSKAFSLRDHRRLGLLNEALRDRVVILVPSRSIMQENPQGSPEDFAAEQDRITMDVAVRVYDLLRTVGASPVIVDAESPAVASPTAAENTGEFPVDRGRVTVATHHEAVAAHPSALVLCLQCDWNASPQAQGVATFFWGEPASGQPYAPIGQMASTMILRELVARTGAQDLGSHARQWSGLRSAGTTAAWVALGYLSNDTERARLQDGSYRARLAEALLCGLQRVLAPSPEAESTATGTMSLADIQSYYRRNP